MDRNRSTLFDTEPIKQDRGVRVDRMKSNIFFSDYVPSNGTPARKAVEKVHEDPEPYQINNQQEMPQYEHLQNFQENRLKQLEKAFKSQVFEQESFSDIRGARRHFQTQQ